MDNRSLKYRWMGDMSIEKCYHPEFGRYVYQPRVPGFKHWIEPYPREREAKAFLRGVQAAQREAGK